MVSVHKINIKIATSQFLPVCAVSDAVCGNPGAIFFADGDETKWGRGLLIIIEKKQSGMRIVIAGTGEIAAYLAEVLSNESQDVIVVSDDREGLASIDSLSNVLTFYGNPASVDVLSRLKLDECKMFIALRPVDADNIVACSAAKSLGARITVAKVSDSSFTSAGNTSYFRTIGVDCIVDYEMLAAEELMALLRHPWVKTWAEFFGGKLVVAAVYVSSASPLAGVVLSSYGRVAVRDFHVVIIRRNGHTIIPGGNDRIMAGDIVYLAARGDNMDVVAAVNGGPGKPVRKVVIMGGSEIGVRMSESSRADGISFKLIEKDCGKAATLQAEARNCTVICGDGSKSAMMEYAGRCDAYVALTKVDELNILSCVTARGMGVAHQLAIVNDVEAITLAEYFGIDAVITRKQLAANHVFNLLLNASAPASRAIALTDAEIVSVTAREGAPVTQSPVRHLKIPKDITLAGLIHDGVASLIDGNTVILPGDNVMAVCRAGAIPDVQRLFG